MKNTFIVVIIVSFFLLGFTIGKKKSGGLLPDKKMVQVGIIVEDVEKSSRNWAAFLGVETPSANLTKASMKVPTQFMGKPTKAEAKLAFFQLENITIELIEPVGENSTWKEFLDNNGEGIHHIAFNIKGMDNYIKTFGENGVPMIQRGGWETGEYSYMDGTSKLGLIIELLEHYNQ